MEPKERILVKAKQLFMQFGIRSVSMDDVANNMAMSKKTVYHYFLDKDELVDAIMEAHINQIQAESIAFRSDAINAIHEIFLTIDHIVEELSNINPMVLYDLEKFHYRTYERFKEYKDKFLAELTRKNIEWGINEDLYRPEINIDVMCKFRLESLMIPFNVSVFPPGKYNLASLSEEFIEHFVYGLATVKGHKLIQKYNQQRQKNLTHEEHKK